VSAPTDTAASTTTGANEGPQRSPQLATEPTVCTLIPRYGKGEPAIVLIHGWATDCQLLERADRSLEGEVHLVTVDLAGHGALGKEPRRLVHGKLRRGRRDRRTREFQQTSQSFWSATQWADRRSGATPRIGDRVIGIIVVTP